MKYGCPIVHSRPGIDRTAMEDEVQMTLIMCSRCGEKPSAYVVIRPMVEIVLFGGDEDERLCADCADDETVEVS
jgi:hypothetical protein